MNWINIHTDTLRSEDYLGADPIERATWLNLMGWCCSQENGGIIKNAAKWNDRKWQQLCGITKDEATLVSELYHIDEAGNMHVSLYPIDKEQEVASKRETARANGKKGGRPKLKTQSKPTLVNSANPEQTNVIKRKGREGKGIERKEKGIAMPFASKKFAQSWNEWIDYRTERKKKLTPMMITKQLKKLESFTEREVIDAIDRSIASGYTGLFPKTSTTTINPQTNEKGKSQYA